MPPHISHAPYVCRNADVHPNSLSTAITSNAEALLFTTTYFEKKNDNLSNPRGPLPSSTLALAALRQKANS
eukprot:jgi/Mesvir1/11625/Mv26473-RA.1